MPTRVPNYGQAVLKAAKSTIWGSCLHVMLVNVHKMMKQYARVILNGKDKRVVSTVTLFRTLGWLPIDVRIPYFTAGAMFKHNDRTSPS